MKKYLALFLSLIMLLPFSVVFAEEEFMFSLLPDDVSSLEVDPLNPLSNLVKGAWYENVKFNDDVTFPVYYYIADGVEVSGKGIIILLDSGIRADAFIASSGWKEIADKNAVSLIVLESLDGWNEETQAIERVKKAFSTVKARHYLCLAGQLYNLIAYGDGATVGMQFAMENHDNFASVVLFGGEAVTEEYVAQMRTVQQERKSADLKVPCPVWVFANELTPAVEAEINYWKDANNAGSTCYSNEYADYIYMPAVVYGYTGLDNENIAQTRLTVGKYVDGVGKEFLQDVYDEFLWIYARHVGIDAQDLRYFVNPKDSGMELHTAVVDGIKRYWYVYVPEEIKASGSAVPLVVAMSGRGGSSSTYPSLSKWPQVAGDRGFICVFPVGSYGRQLKNGVGNIPMWGTDSADDVKFLRYMVDDIKANYNIDAGRVYVSGHSMGCMMSLTASVTLADVFTAAAATCATLPDSALTNQYYSEIYDCPVFISYGEFDYGSFKLAENAGLQSTFDYYINRYKLNAIEDAKTYISGPYNHYVFTNDQDVPMFRFTVVQGKAHGTLPSESYLFYDEFFSRYYRDAEGKLHYMETAPVLEIR